MAVIKRPKALIPTQIHLVMGGYHLFSAGQWEIMKMIRSFHGSGVERVCSCHCTGELAVRLFRESYREGYIEGGVGRVVEIS